MDALVAAILIVLHSVEGVEVTVNVQQITSLRQSTEAAKGKPNTLVTGGVHCVIGLTDGKFVNVKEDCATIRQIIREVKP